MRRIHRLLAVVLGCVLIGWAIYAWVLPVRYESRAIVLVKAEAYSAAELQAVREAAVAEEIAALEGLELAEAVGLEEKEIVRGLRIKPMQGHPMIAISFRHRDPDTPVKVLTELLKVYQRDFRLRKNDTDTFEVLAEERDRAQRRVAAGELDDSVLQDLEERLRTAVADRSIGLPDLQWIQMPSKPVKVREIL